MFDNCKPKIFIIEFRIFICFPTYNWSNTMYSPFPVMIWLYLHDILYYKLKFIYWCRCATQQIMLWSFYCFDLKKTFNELINMIYDINKIWVMDEENNFQDVNFVMHSNCIQSICWNIKTFKANKSIDYWWWYCVMSMASFEVLNEFESFN